MFSISSPTFSKLKCPHLDSCPLGPSQCLFSHDAAVYSKGSVDGRIGLSSLTYFKDLHKRMRTEEADIKESKLFTINSNESIKEEDKLSKAIDSDISKFLHRAPTGTKISASLREKVLRKLLKSLRQVDASCSLSRAAEIEAELLGRTGGFGVSSVYLSAVGEYIKKLEEEVKEVERGGIVKSAYKTSLDLTYMDLMEIVSGKDRLEEYSYPCEAKDPQSTDTLVKQFTSAKSCRRCGIPFVPSKYYSKVDKATACRYHEGKPERIGGLRVYACCQAPVGDANGCCTSEWHVFEGYKRGDPLPRYLPLQSSSHNKGYEAVVALDAEMSYTVGGYEASRVTLVDFFTESTLLDVLVLPRCPPVLDYNTKWSGVSAQSFEEGRLEVLSFEALRERMAEFINESTILIGHSLDNDLLVLEFTHKLIVDTAILYPHPSRPPYRMSLKALALGHLSELVQQSLDGHDSKEDCLTCIRLVKNYFSSGRKERERTI